MVMFAVIVLLAAGVTTHSLLKRRTATAGTPGAAGPAASPEARAPDGSPVGASAAGLAGIKELEGAFANDDFVFVILPGTGEGAGAELARRVGDAAAKIEFRGGRVGTLTLARDAPGFSQAVGRFGVEHLPAVVAMKKGCGEVVVQGDITEQKLLRAYIAACSAASSFGAGPCCP